MTQKIWQVKIYEDNGADYQLYHFSRKEDVLDSISTTWSKNPKSIHWDRTDLDAILITDAEDRTKVLVLAEAIDFELLTRSTHF